MIERKYSIDYNNPVKAAQTTIQAFIDSLTDLRAGCPNPEDLEWEIRLYQFILLDPIARLKAYQEQRFSKGYVPVKKREVVRKLGWKVP